jgi:hypothetical protein
MTYLNKNTAINRIAKNAMIKNQMELNLVEFKFSLMRCSKIIQEYILNQ